MRFLTKKIFFIFVVSIFTVISAIIALTLISQANAQGASQGADDDYLSFTARGGDVTIQMIKQGEREPMFLEYSSNKSN